MKTQIKPNIGIENTKLLGLIENIHNYRTPIERFKNHKKTIEIEKQYLYTYEILITKDDVKFYLGFDDKLKETTETELNICWKNATFKKANNAPIVGKTKELDLEEHYFLGLHTDLRAEYPLSNMLESQNVLRDGESILIRLEMESITPTWYREIEHYIEVFNKKNKIPSKKILDPKELIFKTAETALDLVYTATDFVNDIISDEKIEHEYPSNTKYSKLIRNGLSRDTQSKSKYNAYKTRILVTINSKREDMLFRNILKSFNSMAGDNKFKLVNKSDNKNILSSKEIAQIIQMPTKTYQEIYKINNVDNREIEVPRELQKGNISIGKTTLKGKDIDTYWSENKNILPLPKIVIGPMGSGKSEYTKNFCINASKKDSVIVFDYIKNCELSNDIAKSVKNTIIIDLSKLESLNGLGYPEVKTPSDTWGKLKKANILSRQVEYLINSLNDEPLSPRMSRYLDAAAKVVFIHSDSKISDVIDVLTNWKVRGEFIRKSKEVFSDDDTEIVDLLSLHERDKEGKIIGTRENKIEGILDRISIMMKDIYIRQMMRLSINKSEDFTKYMDEGKTILIQLPEHTFTNKQIKDTIVTYYMSRIWLAALQRKSNKICHIVTDEIHQVPTAAKLVSEVITEGRKFGVGFYFTIHYLRQFRKLQSAIQSAGASYMLLAGTEKENLVSLSDEIKPFTIDEGLSLKPFTSLNIINYGNQYARFISKLPKPI